MSSNTQEWDELVTAFGRWDWQQIETQVDREGSARVDLTKATPLPPEETDRDQLVKDPAVQGQKIGYRHALHEVARDHGLKTEFSRDELLWVSFTRVPNPNFR
jgi:hypothetical protein